MVSCGFLTKIFQFLLITSDHYLLVYIFCEQITEAKVDTKVDIEITYRHHYSDDKIHLSQKDNVFKIVHFLYSIPYFSKSEKGNNRALSNNNNNNRGNLRHGFRFNSIDKGASAITLSTYDTDSAEIGPRIQKKLVFSGPLIHVLSVIERYDDNSTGFHISYTACDDTVNNVPSGWIALINGGSCGVEQKLRQIMKMSNHPATVLIYGNPGGHVKQDSYVSFNQDENPIVIFLPWTRINGLVQRCYNSSGHIQSELLSKMNKSSVDWLINNQNHCNVTIRIYSSSDDSFLNKTSVLFVSISFILLMVISLAWLMFYYVQRFRYIHTKEQFSRRLAHMAKKAVAKIPVKTLKQGDKETDPDLDNCAICIECYKISDTVRILPCKHYFHKSCIDPWLLEQRSCPMCKLNILHAYGFLPNERGSIISDDRLSELDSSLELQFISATTVAPPPISSTRFPTYCQPRDTNYPILPSIFTETGCGNTNRWSSLLLKRPQRINHRIDRSMSLRHLSCNPEERITFLSHNQLLSHSATDSTIQNFDHKTPSIPTLKLSYPNNSSTAVMTASYSQSTIYSH